MMTANAYGYDELVFAGSIRFDALGLDDGFHGVAHVGYVPGEQIVGPATLARAIERLAGDRQVQERFTQQIASWLDGELAPRGVGVVVEAVHPPRTRAVTTALHGVLREDPRTRREFLDLTRRRTT